MSGFRRGLTSTLKKYADSSGLLDKVKVEIAGDDFREGLTAIISVKVAEPQFEGQTKTKLGNGEVKGMVDNIVYDGIQAFLEQNPKVGKKIIEKAAEAARARIAAKKARELVRKKSGRGSTTLPGKLVSILSSAEVPDAAPPIWKVLMVSCVPGSPIDCAATIPTDSPISTL